MADSEAGRAKKSDQAFRTIGEVSDELGVAQHVLRYWESRFPQLRPVQRAGKRRYYRPDDVMLVRRIHRLLAIEGYTVKGVQQLLGKGPMPPEPAAAPVPQAAAPVVPVAPPAGGNADLQTLRRVRDMLTVALSES